MSYRLTATVLLITCAAVAPAHADLTEYKDHAIAAVRVGGKVTRATANRVRRATAFGPHAGSYTGVAMASSTDFAMGVTFGMALYTFDIPSVLDIDKLLIVQVQRIVRDEVARITSEGGVPDPEAIARKAYADLKDDLMGDLRPRTLERPKLGVILEGIAQFQPANAMGARVTLTYGLGPISLGVGGSFLRGSGNTTRFIGPEASLRLTPWGKHRTPVLDLYVRADFGFDEGDRPFAVTVGGRALLDLI